VSRKSRLDPEPAGARRLSAFERDFGNSTKPEAIRERYAKALKLLRAETKGVFSTAQGYSASKQGIEKILSSESMRRQIRRYWNSFSEYTHDPARIVVRVKEDKNLRDEKFLKRAQFAAGQHKGAGKFKFVSMPSSDNRAHIEKDRKGKPLLVSNGLVRLFKAFNKRALLSDDTEERETEVARVFWKLINPPELGLYPTYIGLQNGAYFTATGRFNYQSKGTTYGQRDPKHGQARDWTDPNNWLADLQEVIAAMLNAYRSTADKWMNGLIGYYAPTGYGFTSPLVEQNQARNRREQTRARAPLTDEAKKARARRKQRMNEYKAEVKAAQEQIRELSDIRRALQLELRGKRGKAKAQIQAEIDEQTELIRIIIEQVSADKKRLGLSRKKK
jgi:hypothetical protein